MRDAPVERAFEGPLEGVFVEDRAERDTVYCKKCNWLRLVPRLVLYKSRGGSVVIAMRLFGR